MGKRRGAPEKPPEVRRSEALPIRLTKAEKALVEAAAGGRKASAWARRVLLNAAKRAAQKSAGDH